MGLGTHRLAFGQPRQEDTSPAWPAEAAGAQGLREHYLPEVTLRDRVEHRNSQYAAACVRGGLQPDLVTDAGWWQTPLWRYAVFALVTYSRAAAERPAVPVEDIARRIAARRASSHRVTRLWSRGPWRGERGPQPAV